MPDPALPSESIIALANGVGDLCTFRELGDLTLVCNDEPITGISFEQQPRRDIARDCIDWAAKTGILTNFIACVLYSKSKDPGFPPFQALVKTVLPGALDAAPSVQPQVYAVVSGISHLEELMKRDEVRGQLAASRDKLMSITQSINLLVIYKTLHDTLHRLQTTQTRTLLQAALTAVDDQISSEMIAGYIGATNRAVTDIRGLITAPEKAMLLNGFDQSWIDILKQSASKCQDGLDNGLPARIRIALRSIAIILSEQSPLLNKYIFNSANRLPFADLAAALGSVSGLDKLYAGALDPAIAAITELRKNLIDRVTAHDRLQTVEQNLSILAECLDDSADLILGQMAELWPETRSSALSTNGLDLGPATYVIDQKDSDRVDGCLLDIERMQSDPALAAKVPDQVKALKRAFFIFQSKVGSHFFEVDSKLKSDFDSTAQISNRLQAIVGALP